MQLPADGGGGAGGVGGNTDVIEAGAKTLSQEATSLAPASGEVNKSGAQAKGAAGDPSAISAMASFTTAWSRCCEDLAAHVHALSRLAQSGSHDLVKAGGTPAAPAKPRSPSIIPGIPGLYPGPFHINSLYPTQAPGWHPPMQPGYVPPQAGK